MRDLVVCCDGTWQDATDRSNVIELYERLDLDSAQKKYVAGVGTGGLIDHVRGGIVGWGIDRDLLEGYRFLVEQYRADDRISLFGFSRGAYLARSLAGMIGRIGIVDRTALEGEALEAAVAAAYGRYKTHKAELKASRRTGRNAPPEPAADDVLPLAYDPRSPDIPVLFLGVWDTVGALGIPSHLGLPDLLGSRDRYEFLDVVLDPRIPYARHAVSLDEMRGPFRPTLWDQSAAGVGQDIAQMWFPGDHCDVGGGHDDDSRLSDAEAAMQPRPRATPPVDASRPLPHLVHASAYARQQATAAAPREEVYRPTRTLGVGETAEVVVEADQSWNATGLYLEPGTYRFTATGRWGTPLGGGGPAGAAAWPVLGDGFARVVDLVEQGLRQVVRNPEAELIGARREADAPLMALVGLVANEVTDSRGDVVVTQDGERLSDEKFVIGDAVQWTVTRAGYLWAYGNDAWGSYGNNRGQVDLAVQRLQKHPPTDPAVAEPAGNRG
jgi:hypothetical protein